MTVLHQPECFGTRAVLGLEIIFFGLVVHYISFNAPVTALEKSLTEQTGAAIMNLAWVEFLRNLGVQYILRRFAVYVSDL